MKTFTIKEYLHYNIKIMKYLGLWPRKDYVSDKLYILYTIIVNVFFNFATTSAVTMYVFTSSTSLEDVVGAGYFLLGVMASLKAFFIMRYSNMFKELVTEEIFKSLNVELTQDQNNILCSYVGFWRKIHRNYNYLSLLLVINYVVVPMLGKTPYATPLHCWYPFDYKKPVVYQLVYFHQSISAFIECTVNINGATLAAGLLAYLTAECEVLVTILKDLNKDSSEEATTDLRGMKMCIEYYKSIVWYSKRVETYFSKYLLVQFTASCLSTALIMTSLSLRHDSSADFWFLTVLQIGVWADLYIYCWYGNELTERSKKIPYAAFECNWLVASKEFKKDLIFFIHRTQRPIKVYAINFIELSLQTFIGILRTAYSYYVLLRQLSRDE